MLWYFLILFIISLAHGVLLNFYGVTIGLILLTNLVIILLMLLYYGSFELAIKKNKDRVGFIMMGVMILKLLALKLYFDWVKNTYDLSKSTLILLLSLYLIYLAIFTMMIAKKLNKI